VDLVTHGLASFAVTRALFPRADKPTIAAAVVAGCVADADWLALYFGPAAALSWRGTYFHSLFAAGLIALLIVLGLLVILFSGLFLRTARTRETAAMNVRMSALLLAPLCAASLHVAMDVCQTQEVMLLWPFTTKRFATDWLPPIDPWILTILILALAGPELLHLVNSEIGAKSKRPRGQLGALVGLLLLLVYVGLRGSLHANAVGLMEARSFHGELARRAWAYPESLSVLTWHGIAETESSLNEIDVNLASTGTFDADTSWQIFKPESSPALEAARKTHVAKEFLAVAQVPKASVEKTDVGYVVILRDLRYAASGETRREIAALIELDPDANVTAQEFVWGRELHGSF
jgi:hypothetical protein